MDEITPGSITYASQTQQDIARLVPNRPDAEVADELRTRLQKAFEPIIDIMDEAMRAGLVISWGGFMFNPQTGHYTALPIDVSRHF